MPGENVADRGFADSNLLCNLSAGETLLAQFDYLYFLFANFSSFFMSEVFTLGSKHKKVETKKKH